MASLMRLANFVHLLVTSWSSLCHLLLTSCSSLAHLLVASWSPLGHLFVTSSQQLRQILVKLPSTSNTYLVDYSAVFAGLAIDTETAGVTDPASNKENAGGTQWSSHHVSQCQLEPIAANNRDYPKSENV